MARVTVEDCILKVPNRFELVLLASQRSRDLSAGAEETLERDNDKNPVVALREIAEETIDIEELKDGMIFGLQKYIDADEPEDENTAILAAEKEWAEVITDPSGSGISKSGISKSGIGDAAAADAAALRSDGKDDDLMADGDPSESAGDLDPVAPPAEDESADDLDPIAPPAEDESAG